MAYDKSYQTQIAGRTREDETSFYGKNKVAVPGHVVTFVNKSAAKQPAVTTDYLHDQNSGKIRPAADLTTESTALNKSAYNTVPINAAI